MLTVHGQQLLVKVSKMLIQKMSRPEGDSNPPNLGFTPNALIIRAIRARHVLSHVFEYWLWWYRYFFCKEKLTFGMLTVRGQQHSFSTHERMFLWKCQSFWERRCFDLRGTPKLRIHAECSNHLGYQGQTICCPMFLNTDSGGMDIFEVKLTFEMLTVRWQQNSFSTHERMFLWKCQSFWDRKCLDLRGTRTHNLRIHAEYSNHLSYQGQTCAVPYFWILALTV